MDYLVYTVELHLFSHSPKLKQLDNDRSKDDLFVPSEAHISITKVMKTEACVN